MKKAISGQLSAIGFGARIGFALTLILAACGPRTDEDKAKSAARAFYDVYMRVRPSGVPSRDQQFEFKKTLSVGLAGLLEAASTAEDNAGRDPGGAPSPKLEGDVFTSFDQGAVTYKVARCEVQAASAVCLVELANSDSRNAKVAWKDRVFVIQEGDRWVVDDIEFFGDKQFMHKGRLREVLKQVLDDANAPAV